jgi:SAM-dependent methyltransferase
MKLVPNRLRRALVHPLVRDCDVETAESVETHRQMILAKPLLKKVYKKWYRELLPSVQATAHIDGPMVEIGCGAGFLDEVIPEVVRTDAVQHAYSDRQMDALNLQYQDGEVRCLFAVNVLHHLEEPALFLTEAQRCLAPGGRLTVVEPHNGFFNRLLCGSVDHYEYLDGMAVEWKNKSRSRMTEANMALSWIIFCRDREEFSRRFPGLRVAEVTQHTFLAYALTGGMTFRSFLPGWAFSAVAGVEWLMKPFMKSLGTCMTVVIEKRPISGERT